MAGSEPGQPIGDVEAGGRHLVECAAIRSYAAAELTRARAREHVAVLLRTRSTGLMSTRFNARSNPRARSCRRAGVGLGLDADAAGVINATRRAAARPITASVRFDLMPLLGTKGAMMTPSEREEVLSRWVEKSSDAEQDRQERAERMVNQAIEASPLTGTLHKVYPKGSYPNQTNVRLDSDVDIVVECREFVHYDSGPGVAPPIQRPPYGGSWSYASWRAAVTEAIKDCFGTAVDASGKIAIFVPEVPGSRPSIDIVPSHQYHRYYGRGEYEYAQGSAVWTTEGQRIVNWPDQQLTHGNAKDRDTRGRYKQMVRALKRAENVLVERKTIDDMPSYFMECLVYNVEDPSLTAGTLHTAFANTLGFLYGAFEKGSHHSWLEPNRLNAVFGDAQKWTPNDAMTLLSGAYDLMEY